MPNKTSKELAFDKKKFKELVNYNVKSLFRKEIEEASGCEYMKLCDGAYLIETEQNHISISLKGENAVFQGDF